jgi:hypothetical protein
MDFYSGLESKAALEHYDRAILQRRGDQTEPAARGRRRRAA